METENKTIIINELTHPVFERDSDNMFHQFMKIRRQTIELVETLEIEDFVVQTDTFMSPMR